MSETLYQPALAFAEAHRFIVISGCSGGGKSSLLAELGRRGFSTFEEPGRQIVKEQHAIGGDALPWRDVLKFAELALSRSIHNMITAARMGGLTFFDRGIVDQVAAIDLPHFIAAAERFRYGSVFVVPPWREIFRNDDERRHSFEASAAGYPHLIRTFERFGYRPIEIPKLPIAARADFVLSRIAS